MIHRDILPDALLAVLEEKGGDTLATMDIPPPVFLAMRGEFVMADPKEGVFRCRFPVLAEQLNPFGYMQGGMVAAALDNTIGPLSMLVAPPSVTLKMEVEYQRGISREVDYIYTKALFQRRRKRILHFQAMATDESEELTFAMARATHYVIKAPNDKKPASIPSDKGDDHDEPRGIL